MAVGRSLIKPFLAVNLVVNLIILALAGWSIGKYIDGEQDHPHLGGNTSTIFLLIFALIGGAIGVNSVLTGLIHLQAWSTESMAAASSSALLSSASTSLAFGLVCKQIIIGGHRGKRLQTLEAFVTISAVSQLLYILLLHSRMFRTRYNPSHSNVIII